MPLFSIRKAINKETDSLTSIALKSKAIWGYDATFMEQCREELTLMAATISSKQCYLAEIDSSIAGFYLLDIIDDQRVEMEMLFVHPDFIGKGVGKQLFFHACQRAKATGHKEMEIQADPFAQKFYERMGAKMVRQTPSQSIKGRFLPFMIYFLDN